jgi:mRNA interferase MazF
MRRKRPGVKGVNNMAIVKNFLEWIGLKEKIHNAKYVPPLFKEGEVWWCALGENIGIEINGKGSMFSRPVLVYKKFSKDGFLGIPLSTKDRSGSWYVKISFQGKESTVNLSQIRAFSASRMYDKMGELEDNDRVKIKDGFLRLYC